MAVRKLDWCTVKAVRELVLTRQDLTYREIGEPFGLSPTRVAMLVLGTTWKDRSYTPVKRKRNKLNWDDVRAIRRRSAQGEYGSHLAKEFGISAAAVHFIISGAYWKNDPEGHVFVPMQRIRCSMPTEREREEEAA